MLTKPRKKIPPNPPENPQPMPTTDQSNQPQSSTSSSYEENLSTLDEKQAASSKPLISAYRHGPLSHPQYEHKYIISTSVQQDQNRIKIQLPLLTDT